MNSISCNGVVFSQADQNPSNQNWTDALIAAHSQHTTFCLCSPTELPLVIKRYGAGTENVRYGLARWPDTGLKHSIECQFFNEDDSDTTETLSAFEDLNNGNVRVHLDVPLTRTVEKGHAAEFARSLKPTQKRTEITAQRERATDKMLLIRLWRQSRLNVFSGRPRKWFNATFAIVNTAKKIVINGKGETLADYLYIACSPNDKLAATHNEAVLKRVEECKSRMFVLGRMRAFKSEKLQTILPFIGMPEHIKTLISVASLDELVSDGNFIKNILHSGFGNVIGLATIEPAGNEWWKAVSLVCLPCSENLIPVSTSAEMEFAGYLVGRGRSFIAPLQTTPISTAPTVLRKPEFILLDTKDRIRIQLWGTRFECCLAEKDAAIIATRTTPNAVIHWSANPRESMPDLPFPTPAASQ